MSENQSEKKQAISKEPVSDIDIEIENEKQAEQVKQVVVEAIRSEFSGPMPPPNILSGYEEILPGAADRILSMAERQSMHRQTLEEKMVKAESRDSLLGVLFAFLLGFGCIVAAVIMTIAVPENAGAMSGAALGITGIGAIITTFIKSTRRDYKRRQDSEKEKKE